MDEFLLNYIKNSFEFLIAEYGFKLTNKVNFFDLEQKSIFAVYYCLYNDNGCFVISDLPNYYYEPHEFYKFEDFEEIATISAENMADYLRKHDVSHIREYSFDRDLWDKKTAEIKEKNKKFGFFKRRFRQTGYSKYDVLEIVSESIKRQIAQTGQFYGIKVERKDDSTDKQD